MLNTYILNSAALIAKRSIYIKYADRLCRNPLPIICGAKSGFDVDDLNDFNYVKDILKKMDLNLKNLKFKAIDAPYPIGFINNFIDEKDCESLCKEIIDFKTLMM